MKIVFAGTSDFGEKALEYLILKHNVELVITNPDRQSGRGRKVSEPPIKKCALKNNIPLYQPENFSCDETVKIISEINPDFIIVVSYGHIIKKNVLDVFSEKWINIHASLLPELRGAAPINFSILNGLKKTGISIMKISEKMDAGDVLLQREIDIKNNDNAGTLFNKLTELSVETLDEFFRLNEKNLIVPVKQDEMSATYTKKIDKNFCRISFEKDCEYINRFIRAFSPYPGAWTTLNSAIIKIYECSVSDIQCEEKTATGGIIIENKKMFVKCGDCFIEILELQSEGKKRVDAKSFINGIQNKNVDLKFE